MRLARRLAPALFVTLIFFAGSQHQLWAAPARDAALGPAEVQVDLFRGLADVFSRGMDTLTHRLNQEGYSARVYSTNQWPTAAQRIAGQYMRQHKVIVVHIGHSLGGNAIYDAAYDLDQRNIPVELLVPFDKSPSRAEERPPCGELLPAERLRQTGLAGP